MCVKAIWQAWFYVLKCLINVITCGRESFDLSNISRGKRSPAVAGKYGSKAETVL